MPVTSAGAGTPTVSVQVPVPTPVQPAPKPKKPKPQPVVQPAPVPTGPAPVSFGGTLPHQHPSNLSAVVLPWSPPPQGAVQMGRRLEYAIRYTKKGNVLTWRTFDGRHHTGEIIDTDNGTVIVRMADGKERAVRCDRPEDKPIVDRANEIANSRREPQRMAKRVPKLYRGISPESGTKSFRQGKGLYVTTDPKIAAGYGTVVEVHPSHLPKNPLKLRSEDHWDGWLVDQYINKLGMRNVREFNAKYPDPGEYVRSLGFDGVQIGDGGKGTTYVSYHAPQVGPEQMSRRPFLPRKVVRYSADSHTLPALFRAAREDPYDETRHGVIADAIEEQYPGSPFPELIRQQFGLGNHAEHGPKRNIYQDDFYNSYDGTFPYTARLGKHGPFNLYLGHGSAGDSMTPEGSEPRWYVHAISRFPDSNDSGYTFEIPHEQAHVIPQMFPAAAAHISPEPHVLSKLGSIRSSPTFNSSEYLRTRGEEANRFDELMDQQENQ